ncbi:MAG: beta-lactamase family protein [Actinobacteria bacterium]|nr:beta-lactamase family protein [Actinomycetota bacterium]MBV8958197.1 beta-lactamase family protein [Actinomycetota bacterium]MBV9664198.1 beta-lactamase family protein [Actinomycetota bacterium]MBV9932838.1 beta-lactamase family protein [Actinomycetota bacterium]
MAEVHGTYDPRFEAVRDALANTLDQGMDVGASVAVVHEGETVVDIWGGFADEAKTKAWERDTIINVWSTTKTMTALCALLLADRGDLDFDAPVAKYWPEFKAAGKENVEVRHLMSHNAGLSGWQEPMKPEDLYDWEKATSLLAGQEPWWDPGTASGYHAVTQGYLVGEVVRRITGKSVGAFFADEFAGPLGADFHIGTPAECDDRVALVIPPPPLDMGTVDPTSIPIRTLANPPLSAEQSWEIPWRRAEIPAAGGHGNARSVAAVQALLSNGGELGGKRFLSPEGCEVVLKEQSHTTDLVLGLPIRFGMGYGLTSDEMPLGPNPRTCFWGGWGGSLVLIDMDARLCITYVMNKMGEGTLGDFRGVSVAAAAFGSLAGS